MIHGNSITIMHAATLIIPVVGEMLGLEYTMMDFLNDFRQNRLTVDRMLISQCADGFILSPQDEFPTEHFLSSTFQLAEFENPNQMWIPGEGIVALVHEKGILERANIEFRQHPVHAEDTEVTISDSPQDVVEPTVPFPIMRKMQVNPDTCSHTYMIAEGLPHRQIENLWFGKLQVKRDGTHSFPDVQDVLMLTDRADDDMTDSCQQSHGMITIIAQEKIHLVAANLDTPICDQNLCPQIPEDAFDLFGPLHLSHRPTLQTLIMESRFMHASLAYDVKTVFAAFSQVVTSTHWNAQTDVFTLHIKGPCSAVEIIAGYWSGVLPHSMQAKLGRLVTIETVTTGTNVHFRPVALPVVCPPLLLEIALSVAGVRAMLDALPFRDDAPAVHIRIVWLSRTLWEGTVMKELNTAILLQFLRFALTPAYDGIAVRLLCRGKQLPFDARFDDLTMLQNEKTNNLHVILALSGGGSKQQQRNQQQAAIASLLLEHGFELPWITRSTDVLLEKFSISRLQQLTGLPPGAEKIQTLFALMKEARLEIPEIQKPLTRRDMSGHSAQPKKKRRDQAINPMDYQLIPNWFTCQDGTSTAQLNDFKPQTSGVCLMLPEQATPFLCGDKLSTDELAIVVLGALPQTIQMPCKQVKFPCMNLDRQMVILAGSLFQLGARDINVQSGDPQQVKTDKCTLNGSRYAQSPSRCYETSLGGLDLTLQFPRCGESHSEMEKLPAALRMHSQSNSTAALSIRSFQLSWRKAGLTMCLPRRSSAMEDWIFNTKSCGSKMIKQKHQCWL